MPFGFAAKFSKEWARISLWSFFSDVRIEGYEEATTEDQPRIFAATHHNMLLDPAVLCNVCSKEYLHYWAKSSIFVNEYATRFLNSVGCVPVDRESKDHLSLYQSTFDVMELNECIALFPEGTSHTLSRISKLKDGASFVREMHKLIPAFWTNLRYGQLAKPAAIVPVGIVYTEKSSYRSVVIVRFGKPIQMEGYLADFSKAPKATAKLVTKALGDALLTLTVNSPNWPDRKSAAMAREILFPGEYGNMPDFIQVSQSLINIFVEQDDLRPLADNLHAYWCELKDLKLRDTDLACYGGNRKQKFIPRTIIKNFISKSLALFMDLPVSLPIVLVHLPLYLISQHYSKHEVHEEVKAQDKILYATLMVPVVYLSLFIWLWYYLYRFTFCGFLFAVLTTIVFFWLHVVSIDRKYEQFKQWKGSFQLLDAFVLKRGLGNRKKRLVEIAKLRDAIQNDLQQVFLRSNADASLDIKILAVDLLNPSVEHEKRSHKLKRLVQSPNSYFMDVKCPGCLNISTVFSHAQTVVLCSSCGTVLCQPTGGRARLTEGCSFRRKAN
ncbi:acyltransferase [Mucor ambiguus]|uniref:40S ribosomal protein S27 n=1 Tax=Mucor ambiguus TaxID=91626 RepID=A0A0C9LU68_9FUNG|nr:acyltransferase [Mucor ambiguus]